MLEFPGLENASDYRRELAYGVTFEQPCVQALQEMDR
mgnify:FL=1